MHLSSQRSSEIVHHHSQVQKQKKKMYKLVHSATKEIHFLFHHHWRSKTLYKGRVFTWQGTQLKLSRQVGEIKELLTNTGDHGCSPLFDKLVY